MIAPIPALDIMDPEITRSSLPSKSIILNVQVIPVYHKSVSFTFKVNL